MRLLLIEKKAHLQCENKVKSAWNNYVNIVYILYRKGDNYTVDCFESDLRILDDGTLHYIKIYGIRVYKEHRTGISIADLGFAM
jgi:hypothetical protein